MFGASHVERLRDMWGIEASFALPLQPEIASSADGGVPLVVTSPRSESAATYLSLAKAVRREVEALPERKLPELLYVEPTANGAGDGGREGEGEGQVLISGLGGDEVRRISPHALRRLCRSPTNRPDSLPERLRPLEFVPMGNYAVSISWSDGHQSLIPYASLASAAAVG